MARPPRKRGRTVNVVPDVNASSVPPFGGETEPFVTIDIPDNVTAAVMAGAPQIGEGAQIIPGDELLGLHTMAAALVNAEARERAFRDGVLCAAFLNGHQNQRAAEIASDYGLRVDELGEYQPPAPRDR